MDFYVNLFLVSGWLLFIGYFLRLWRKEYLHLRQIRRDAQVQVEQRVSEPVTYTAGAAYDACLDEPTTDYDAEAVRKLLNSW